MKKRTQLYRFAILLIACGMLFISPSSVSAADTVMKKANREKYLK